MTCTTIHHTTPHHNQTYDVDNSGTIDLKELVDALKGDSLSGLSMSPAEVENLLTCFDSDGNAVLDEGEFIKMFKDAI